MPSGTTERGALRASRRAAESRARTARAAGVAALGLMVLSACATSGNGDGESASLAGSPSESGTSAGQEVSPSTSPEVDIEPDVPAGDATPVGGKPWNGAVTAACEQALAGDGMSGLTEIAQTADADGVTSFWVSGKTWVACDSLADAGSTEPELFVPQPRAGGGFDEKTLAVSATIVEDATGDVSAVRYAAAGELPWPVQEMSYTFPDGHTEQARFVSGVDGSGAEGRTFWSVAYTATEGPLVDPTTESADLDPVTISIVGAAAEAFRLPWEDAQRED